MLKSQGDDYHSVDHHFCEGALTGAFIYSMYIFTHLQVLLFTYMPFTHTQPIPKKHSGVLRQTLFADTVCFFAIDVK